MKDNIVKYDFICSSGGLKAMFLVFLPKILYNKCKFDFDRASGASSGAFCAAAALCKIDTIKCINIYNRELNKFKKTGIKTWAGELLRMFCDLLPEDCHTICNNKLKIAVHVLTYKGIKRQIFSEFTSKEDLIDCILASSTIPYYTFPYFCYKFRDMNCIDGVYPDVFDDNKKALYINLWNIEYPFSLSSNILDENIKQFSKNGLKEFILWYKKRHNSNIFSISYNTKHIINNKFIKLLLENAVYIFILIIVLKNFNIKHIKYVIESN
jgi:hypothetical protein